MSSPFIPIQTAEIGWHSDQPFSVAYDDIYYSAGGGIDHCSHVFIDGNDLINRWQALSEGEEYVFNIAETGFGTGLNFLLTWSLWELHAPKSAKLRFVSCEQHPLCLSDLKKALSNWPQLAAQAQQLIHQYPVLTPGYHQLSFCEGRVQLTLMLGDALECYEQLLICADAMLEPNLRTVYIDAWYLDGFAPSKNERMWSEPLFKVIAFLSQKGTTLATYTAASSIKSSLINHGFTVLKKKGYGPKRHMISAYCAQPITQRLKHRHTPWHVGIPTSFKSKNAVVIGAGLAGCFAAYSLAKRGWKVTLIEELASVGKGASANQQAVLFPKLSAFRSPLTQFLLHAFLYAADTYTNILKDHAVGELKGSLLLAYNLKEKKAQESLQFWLSNYPELGVLVNPQEASELAGITLDEPGLFIPNSGWINSPALCQVLTEVEGISIVTNTRIEKLILNDNIWQVNDLEAEVVILANGQKLTNFEQTQKLPVKAIRGQMTVIPVSNDSVHLKIPLCGEGHVLPSNLGHHTLGATYGLGIVDAQLLVEDDILNLSKLDRLTSKALWSKQVVSNWAGIRATTPDYLPLVGPVPHAEQFVSDFLGLQSNSNRWIANCGSYYPGLFACAGFGSRGLTTVPLCADWLASLINGELSTLPRNLIQAISPARFLRRDITRLKIAPSNSCP